MTDQVQDTVEQIEQKKQSDKEHNIRMMERKYQREVAEANARAQELERQLQEKNKIVAEEEEEDDEPYVAPKKLEKKLARFEEKTSKKTSEEINRAVEIALEKERNNNWLASNSDFDEIMSEQNVQKFIQKHKALADSISRMPQGFEREKLVYANIKELGVHKHEQKQSSVQDKVDANKRTPYYQPSGVGTAPYSNVGDFSQTGQKQAYEKMQQLKSKYGM
jgi:hypothetical protein